MVETGADTSLIFVPARFAIDAIIEAADSGVNLIVCITEGIPVLDMVRVLPYLSSRSVRLIGPNCPGLYLLEHAARSELCRDAFTSLGRQVSSPGAVH